MISKRKLITYGILGLTGFGLFKSCDPYTRHPSGNYAQVLADAKEIEVKESAWNNVLSWFKAKKYHILVDDYKVAEVTGQYITTFGNTFELKDDNGNLLASEDEKKRWMNFDWNRGAQFYDSLGTETISIGEEKVNDFLSVYYNFHFYNATENEIAISKKLTKTSFGDHKIKDMSGNDIYDIDKRFILNPFRDKYILTKKQESVLGNYEAVLMTCIEDIIADSNE